MSSVLLDTSLSTVKVLLCLVLLFQTTMAANQDNLSRSVNLFASQLYNHLPNTDRNVIYSPMSIQTCLSMAFLGAAGKTADEMRQVMNFVGRSNQDVSEQFRSIIEAIEKEDGLRIANKIFVKNSYKLNAVYSNLVQQNFKSSVQPMNFGDSAAAAHTINSWVEEKTNNRIKDLISADSLSEATRTVLVNAIYFKGKWKYPFNPSLTQPKPFWTSPQHSLNVDAMFISKKFRYGQLPELDAAVIELPYEKSSISMFIILPNQINGLKQLENHIQNVNIEDINSKLRNAEVDLHLPKFEFEYQADLVEALKAMGIRDAFTPGVADFSGLLESSPNAPPERLHISSVVHKAFIKVDEEGAEAAAATGVVIQLMSMPIMLQSYTMTVDRPFMFMLALKDQYSRPYTLFSGSIKELNASH